MSPAVAKEISSDALVAAVLSELDDIIAFEKEQIASLEGFSWVEKTFSRFVHTLALAKL